ncbi:MAG: MBL fold metallo-hydrolase [Halobacteria archaeon]|nr:MBL fold metallo-hydrolase [Halobacteria archaeon]
MRVVNIAEDAEVFTSNAYLVLGDSSTDLVDVGSFPGATEKIREYADDIDSVYLTHGHSDHVGNLAEVREEFDADLYAYDYSGAEEVEDCDEVEIGDESFEVVYTPGHADDHVTFVGEETVFSGDVFVYNDGAYDDGSFGRTDMAGQSRETLIESLRRVIDRLPETAESLYPGHGDEFHGDISEVVERALERAERREPKY